jgi:DNA mismatch repair protein MutS
MEFAGESRTDERLLHELERIAPAEILAADGAAISPCDGPVNASAVQSVPVWHFDVTAAGRRCWTSCRKWPACPASARFACTPRSARPARCCAMPVHARQGPAARAQPDTEYESEFIGLDAATRRNLELTETLRGTESPTLFSLLDTCRTTMGSRLLRHWLHHPPRDAQWRAVAPRRHRRADARRRRRRPVGHAGAGAGHRTHHHARRAGHRAAARPRRAARRPGAAAELRSYWRCATVPKRGLLKSLHRRPGHAATPASTCSRAVAQEPAAMVRDGGVIARGFDVELDELRALSENAGQFLVDLETRERARTGIANLRVEYNKVHGFYIEVTNGQADKVPDDYRRRQTLKNANATSRPS